MAGIHHRCTVNILYHTLTLCYKGVFNPFQKDMAMPPELLINTAQEAFYNDSEKAKKVPSVVPNNGQQRDIYKG